MQHEFKDVRVGDISLAYIEQGQGTPVIFVHGSGPTDLRTWGQQVEPFAERYRVIAYSQRYHYPNAWIGDGSDINSTRVHAEDLAALINALQLGRAHLIGFSWGADIVLRLAVEHPEMVRTLVVTEPGLYSWLTTLPGGPESFAEYANTMIPAKKAALQGDYERGLRLFVDAVLGSGVYDQLPASAQERLMVNRRLISAEVTDLRKVVTDITREEASRINPPTLILTGEESPRISLLVSQELRRSMLHAEHVQISDAAHLLHVMNPQAYNSTVLGFLARHT